MSRSSSTDVLDTFRFQVDMDGNTRAGFMKCSTPSFTLKTREYVEAGRHMNPLKITQSVTFPPIVLERGVATDSDFIDWCSEIFTINNSGQTKQSNPKNRRLIKIFQYNRTGQLVKSYVLYSCIVTDFKPASDFNAMEDAISMETLTIEYEGFKIIAADGRTVLRQALDNVIGSNGIFT
jgi:phage tail-like protein